MCGLIFLYRSACDEQALKHRVSVALQGLAHRGPDDSGLWCEYPVAIGHRRLAILDLAASRQPMLDPLNRYVLAYNGEAYNFQELRCTLEQHWEFRTRGDTEVMLAGLIIHGEVFLQRVEGMWALAFWDRLRKTVMLSRDRMGKKPLFYQSSTTDMACASELPTLARLTNGSWQEDLDSTADYLRYGYYLPGTTAYQGVCEVLPGHILHWSQEKGVEQRPYWSLSLGTYTGTKTQACCLLREQLTRAVQRRMVADVEVGAFLSGGIDSSLIVGIMTQELGVKPQTFTIGFAEKAFDERRFANCVAQYWDTRHHEQCLTAWDQQLLTELILHHVGQPFLDSSLLPTAHVSKLASQWVKVALSGDGGDELFSGYQRYQARTLLRWYTRLPATLRRGSEWLIRSLPEPMVHHSHSLWKKAHLFCDIVERQASEIPYVAPVLYAHQVFAQLAPGLTKRGHTPPGLPAEARIDAVMEMMAADALVYLPQDILTKVDRASMAYSLEVRAPFLDREVVELVFSLPRPWHRRGCQGKRMLRETFRDLVPRTIWERRKQGFAVPMHQWFRGNLGDELVELIAAHPHIPMARSSILSMLDAHRAGHRDHGYRLWGIYVYLLWKEHASWLRY
jgi:asparagine synthase (glutamine-hydrolysing)